MLLHIVAFTGNVRSDDTSRAQPNPGRLPLCRVGFLGLGDADLDTDALLSRRLDGRERWGDGFSGALSDSAAAGHLHEGCGEWWSGGEGAGGWEGSGHECGGGLRGDGGCPEDGGRE